MQNKFEKSKESLGNSISHNDASAVLGSEHESHKPVGVSQKLVKIKPDLNEHYETKSDFGLSRIKTSVLPIDSPMGANPYSARVDEDYINSRSLL